jgi:hypothetical protein
MRILCTAVAALLAVPAAGPLAQSKGQKPKSPSETILTVDAGAFDRHATIASTTIPGLKVATAVFLNDGKGPTISAQLAPDGEITFVLPYLKAG